MIDHQRRVIFIHQKKVAGMSIAAAWGYADNSAVPFGRDIGHAIRRTYVQLVGDFNRFNNGTMDPEWYERTKDEKSYFVFSAVRNPYDRLISAWKFLNMTRHCTLLEVLSRPPQSIVEYTHLYRPQTAILREPGKHKLVVDDLIRFETLQDDFDRVCDRIGRERVQLPCVNVSVRERDYRQYFNAETRKLAERMFRSDLDAFEYEF